MFQLELQDNLKTTLPVWRVELCPVNCRNPMKIQCNCVDDIVGAVQFGDVDDADAAAAAVVVVVVLSSQ